MCARCTCITFVWWPHAAHLTVESTNRCSVHYPSQGNFTVSAQMPVLYTVQEVPGILNKENKVSRYIPSFKELVDSITCHISNKQPVSLELVAGNLRIMWTSSSFSSWISGRMCSSRLAGSFLLRERSFTASREVNSTLGLRLSSPAL